MRRILNDTVRGGITKKILLTAALSLGSVFKPSSSGLTVTLKPRFTYMPISDNFCDERVCIIVENAIR